LTKKRFKPEAARADARLVRRFSVLSVALVCAMVVAIPQQAGAVTLLPPSGKVFTGVAMGYNLSDFIGRTHHKPSVWEQFVSFGQSAQWAINLADARGTRLMLALSTAPSQDAPGAISPGRIATGHGDGWLVQLRQELGAFGEPVYLRFLGEMNNCHNAYAPLSCSGASRGSSYSSAAFIKAWKRVAVIMRGTGPDQINHQLTRLHEPKLRVAVDGLAPAQVAMVWTPMTGGSPMVSALDPSRFWPGSHWVDWIGTSFYSKFPQFGWLSAYYSRFAARYRKPFMFAEWALWENGDPSFVRSVLAWTRQHPRTRMIVYNQGKRTDGPFRLGHFPAAQSALRQGLTSSLFL
jgi:hypothetical protein